MAAIARALLSVYNKEGIVPFARGLHEMGVELLSTGGTFKAIREAGVPVKEVSEHTGFPEMLDGRVKTLHPKIHGGLLGRRDLPKHREEMARNGILPIDLVAVNLYPFQATVARPGVTQEEAIENIDIGGPSMLRSAAKNHQDVTVIVDPSDYDAVLEEMRKGKGAVSGETRSALARKVFLYTSDYDGAIFSYLQGISSLEARFPDQLLLRFQKAQMLRYGENPHQQGAFYRELNPPGGSIASSRQLWGKELSFNNLLDANSALELAKEFSETAAVIIKHNNPCGTATAAKLVDAYRRARETDPISAFGGVAAFNRTIDLETAQEITTTFMEVVVAPKVDPAALEQFKKKKDLRVLETGESASGPSLDLDLKRVVGGLLVQDRDAGRIESIKKLDVVSRRPPTEEEYAALDFAWKVTKHVRSNAIVFARHDAAGGQTLGIGAGQMSRVDSVKIASMKANLSLSGGVMGSDAFFPFRDAIDEAARAGIRAVIQPGGSIRDKEVIAAADEHDMAMILTGMRHFRH
jgi:phosphoribosylaminoimidazolecarboxamide formyltransferase/IMP cyclohydrolase